MIHLTYSDKSGAHVELYTVEELEYVKERSKRLRKKGWKVTYANYVRKTKANKDSIGI
jgi:hypothetical protein